MYGKCMGRNENIWEKAMIFSLFLQILQESILQVLRSCYQLIRILLFKTCKTIFQMEIVQLPVFASPRRPFYCEPFPRITFSLRLYSRRPFPRKHISSKANFPVSHFPRSNFSRSHFPRSHFPDSPFSESRFPENTFPRFTFPRFTWPN
jgi:hypothetical protein